MLKKLCFAFVFSGMGYLISCSPGYKFNKDKKLFESSKVTRSFTSVADMNDAHFDIRENNFFEFYRQLFDSLKNSNYPGKYILSGDTMKLQFYDKKGKALLGRYAIINNEKNEITFYQ